jgi:N6-adenosine-specific RNA methylase IME4
MIPFPDIRAGAILMDPGIAFKTRSPKGEGRSPQRHYNCAPIDVLAALPIADIALPDCFLFCWIPLPHVPLVEPLMRSWGFEFSGAAFSWAKLYPSKINWFMGTGFSTRHNTEICWLGRRGQPKRKSAGVRELVVSPVRGHSRKPDEVYKRIEALCDGPYVELFARQRWPGWVSWGDQVDMFSAGDS